MAKMSQTQKIVNAWYHFLLDTSHKPPNQFYKLHHAIGLEAVREANLSVKSAIDKTQRIMVKWTDALLKLIYALNA